MSRAEFIILSKGRGREDARMSPTERRQELLEVLCRRRHDTCENLAHEFDVSEQTIRRDIAVLTCSYPVETVFGGHGGGVRIKDGFYINHRPKHSAVFLYSIMKTSS